LRCTSRSGFFSPQAGAGQPAHLQLHQPLRRKADHLAQQVGIRGLLDQPSQGHHLVGHREVSDQVGFSQTRPSPKIAR
jgi:hypothetical protein